MNKHSLLVNVEWMSLEVNGVVFNQVVLFPVESDIFSVVELVQYCFPHTRKRYKQKIHVNGLLSFDRHTLDLVQMLFDINRPKR